MSLNRIHYPSLYFAAGAASLGLVSLFHSSVIPGAKKSTRAQPPTHASPVETLPPGLDTSSLDYPPESFLPGTRDVPTPYGSIRIYEFGPADAQRRVLFLHGISTPSIALFGIAQKLASNGCRVMLMDLFGRGWSGGPADLPYDGRLYASQIFMALASSEVDWTSSAAQGGPGFALVGYSLGGGVAADFTSWFPDLVNDVVLIAPGGILRTEHITLKSRLLYSQGLIPESFLQNMVRKRMMTPTRKTPEQQGPAPANVETGEASTAPSAELPSKSVISTSRGPIDMNGSVNWQVENHPGFLPAFMSSIRNAPIHNQHERWALIGDRLKAQRALPPASSEGTTEFEASIMRKGLKSGKVLFVFGGQDKIVISTELEQDARAVLGAENVEVFTCADAGHEVAISHSEEVAEAIWGFWQRK